MSDVLYRKYRPEYFDRILGQDHITSVLQEVIKNDRISHAYLFTGSRGTGKTSVARILAREVGCTPNDIYEIDAASHTGVDDIRELREGINVMPLESPYKMYILDEVHMLSKSAFNALLKTLEEPPSHALFVLATTELEKLPDTVISRCQVFHFKKPPQDVLQKMVADVAKQEGYKLEPAATNIIALLADGSFRDALGTLQKILDSSFDSAQDKSSGKEIKAEDVERLTGAPASSLVNSFVEAVATTDAETGLEAIGKAVETHTDMNIFLKLILARVRTVLLSRYAPKLVEQFGELSGDDKKWIENMKGEKGINSETLKRLLEASDQMRYAHIAHLPLELALIDIVEQSSS